MRILAWEVQLWVEIAFLTREHILPGSPNKNNASKASKSISKGEKLLYLVIQIFYS